MAESLFNHHAEQQGLAMKAHSSGTDAIPGNQATDLAIEVLAERNIDLANHKAQTLTSHQIMDSNIVIAMTRQHEAAVAKKDPQARSRTFLAGEKPRIGNQMGPLGSAEIKEWLMTLHKARGGHMTSGRLSDEISDPWGYPKDVYEQTARKLESYILHIVRLLNE